MEKQLKFTRSYHKKQIGICINLFTINCRPTEFLSTCTIFQFFALYNIFEYSNYQHIYVKFRTKYSEIFFKYIFNQILNFNCSMFLPILSEIKKGEYLMCLIKFLTLCSFHQNNRHDNKRNDKK